MKAIIYLRLSVLKDDDPTLSPKTQEEAARAYCKEMGWKVHSVASDMDESGSAKGKRLERPALAEAIRTIKKGDADVLVASRLDRIARSVQDGLALSEQIKVAVPQLGLLGGNAQADFTRTLMLALGELEATQISERTRAGVATSRAAGRWASAQVPYGYRTFQGDDGGYYLEHDPVEAPVGKEIMERAARGESISSICRWLNTEEIPTKRGSIWRHDTVLSLIEGVVPLRGWTVHAKQLVRDSNGDPLQITKPLVTARVAGILEARRDERRANKRPAGRPSKHWLQPYLRCRNCDHRMHLNPKASDKGGLTMYCGNEPGLCDRKSQISASVLVPEVERQLLARGENTYLTRVTLSADPVALENEARAKANAVIADLTRQIGQPGSDTMKIAAQIEEQKQRLAQPENQARDFITPTGDHGWLEDQWADASNDERRKILDQMLTTISVGRADDKPRVKIKWKKATEAITIDV